MTESIQNGRAPQLVRPARLVNAAQIARDTEVRQSPNGVRFATFGETGLADLDLDRMLQAVPMAITAALKSNTYYFVPLAMRETGEGAEGSEMPDGVSQASALQAMSSQAEGMPSAALQPAMVASAYSEEFSDAAICHRNVDLEQGRRGVFISTRLMGDRFALSFEFFINVAHAFVDQTGVPESFADLVWQQAVREVRGETSIDAWETRNMAFGRPADAVPEPIPPASRRNRGSMGARGSMLARDRAFARAENEASHLASADGLAQPGSFADPSRPQNPSGQDPSGPLQKERQMYLEAAFSDAVAIYLLSLALDFDYSELREREYPLLHPSALAARLRLVSELFPPNPDYEFAVRYRRRG
ncbi:MAG: hypothetical protein ACP5E5_08960 [Acidobacteriaceae bacterium]